MDIKLVNENAMVPYKKYEDDAGYDLFSCEDAIIPPRNRKLVNTGISIAIPKGTYGRVAPRSGLSCKGIDIGAGVIDSSYCGIIKVLCINSTDKPYEIKMHDRIAQLIIECIKNFELNVVSELCETERGDKGFGSSGV